MKSNRLRIAVAALAVAVAALSLASPASAFIRLTRAAASGTGVVQAHWFDSELPLLSVINATNSDLSYADALLIVQNSAKTWENVNTSYFTVNPVDWTSGPYLAPALALDGQNSMFFDIAGVNFAPGSGVIAFTRLFIDTNDGHTVDVDLVFNDRDFYQSTPDPGPIPSPYSRQTSVDLQSVITHEYGHYFGLDHTSIAKATMIPFILNNTSQRSLELDDRAGLSTVYPESPSRPGGVTPGGADFGATTGTISGTCVSGFTGAATFGAHVEAIDLANPIPEASISAISGELTLRNGQGDWMIYGLPPGSYAVRIVPLDGVHTIAMDADVGGVFDGLDTSFEPEYWNGAGEGGNGYTDLASDYTPVAVSAGANTGGINFVTNTFPGRVEIAQYGQFENVVDYRFLGFRAVRFDPPFDPPYTIEKVSFPTFTMNGVPATFPSVRLCEADWMRGGRPNLEAPVFQIAPFHGSANGINEVPINLTVADSGKVFYWCWEYPAQPYTFPNDFPFLRIDRADLDRGSFGNTYDLPPSGKFGLLGDRNIVASMACHLASPAVVPIEAAANLGMNRCATKAEFSYLRPPDTRADGYPMPKNSLERVDLLWRDRDFGPWRVFASGGARTGSISVDTIPGFPGVYWSAQAVDKAGRRAIPSSVVATTGFSCVQLGCYDADEPNGRRNEATPLTLPVFHRVDNIFPAGDQDFYSFCASPGDVIDAIAFSFGAGALAPVVFLYDQTGNLVTFDGNPQQGRAAHITFAVPSGPGNSRVRTPRKFVLHVADIRGSLASPATAPRTMSSLSYMLNVSATPPGGLAAAVRRSTHAEDLALRVVNVNSGNPAVRLTYILPETVAGSRVTLRIYDVSGRLVRTLVDGSEEPGAQAVAWDGRDDRGRLMASGILYARLEVGKLHREAKVLIMR